MTRYRLQFPPESSDDLGQDEAFFYIVENDGKRRLRLHDYDSLYELPGLYEQVVYERLKCQSPAKVTEILHSALRQGQRHFSELRVLDLGAGNGKMGEELGRYGVARLIGVDIIDDARKATTRDRPGLYDAYYVCDVSRLSPEERETIESWSLDCLTTVAALGFGDIPVQAFVEAVNLIDEHGWVAFNIKETFLDRSDTTGFSKLIRELIFSEYLDLYHLERYRHRLSLEGEPLYYFALAARKNGDVPRDFVDSLELREA